MPGLLPHPVSRRGASRHQGADNHQHETHPKHHPLLPAEAGVAADPERVRQRGESHGDNAQDDRHPTYLPHEAARLLPQPGGFEGRCRYPTVGVPACPIEHAFGANLSLMPRLRPLDQQDHRLLRVLAFEAAFWRPDVPRPPREEALADTRIARYFEGFGRPGDFGVVAEEGAEGLGAAWWRYFQAEAPGYGFVDETTPEISAAVLPAHRGRGIGTALIRALEREARDRGIDRLSLSVERENRAAALYRRLGFQPLAHEGDALTMVLELNR
jgi:GNAT superfamily N-acetyltransferase